MNQLPAGIPVSNATSIPWLKYGLIGFACIAVLAAVVVGIFWYRRHRRKSPPQAVASDHLLSAGSLRKIWHEFARGLPRRIREQLLHYQHYVVLGGPGRGKSQLLSQGLDWQSLSSQFLPSHVSFPLLQIYLGRKAVAQEIGAPLLYDTSANAMQELRRLWQPLFLHRPPIVILVLEAQSEMAEHPDQVRELAQLLRGKVSLLAKVCKAAVPVYICLTHLDQIVGYREVIGVLRKHHVPLEIPLDLAGPDTLTVALQSYERYLPLAMLALPLPAFRSAVSFLRAAPALMSPAAEVARVFQERDLTGAPQPVLKQLIFSAREDGEQYGSLFTSPPTRQPNGASVHGEMRREAGGAARHNQWSPSLRRLLHSWHAVVCTLLLLIVLTTLGVFTIRDALRLHRADDALARLSREIRRAEEAMLPTQESELVRIEERKASEKLEEVHAADAAWLWNRLIFEGEKTEQRKRLTADIRRAYLLPVLSRAIRRRATEQTLYALAVIYASRNNMLGSTVRMQLGTLSQTLVLPADVIVTYIEYSHKGWPEGVPQLSPAIFAKERAIVTGIEAWTQYLSRVEQGVRQMTISRQTLVALKHDAEPLITTLEQIQGKQRLQQLAHILQEESPIDIRRLYGGHLGALEPPQWLTDNLTPLESLLQLIRSTPTEDEEGDSSALYLLQLLRDMDKAPLDQHEIYHIELPERQFDIAKQAWLDLLLRSEKRALLHVVDSAASKGSKRSHRHHRHRDQLTLPELQDGRHRRSHRRHQRGGEQAIASPADANSRFSLPGDRGGASEEQLSSIYNRVAFERDIKPVVRELRKKLEINQQISPREKRSVSRYIEGQMRSYARRYCAALLDYSLGYQIVAPGREDLRTGLLTMVQAGSPFILRLRTTADNANLDGLDDPFLAPLAQCLATFRPIGDLLANSKDGEYPALKPYLSALTQLARELDVGRESAGTSSAAAPPAAVAGQSGSGSGTTTTPTSSQAAPTGGGAAHSASGSPPAGLRPEPDIPDDLGSSSASPDLLYQTLPPLGQSALAMALYEKQSVLYQAERFLDERAIAGSLRRLFIMPFAITYRQGVAEIARTLDNRWKQILLPHVLPLLEQFPFNRQAGREVDPNSLEIINESQGQFWRSFRAYFAPLCVQRNSAWSERVLRYGRISLPRGMLYDINQIAKLSRTLWNPDGSRRPLQFTVRPLPGPVTSSPAQPSLYVLTLGKASVFGFNQQAGGRPILVPWWVAGPAAVAVETNAPGRDRTQTRSVEVTDSPWSFYRLLLRGRASDSGIVTWTLPSARLGDTDQARFQVEPDPWALFQISMN